MDHDWLRFKQQYPILSTRILQDAAQFIHGHLQLAKWIWDHVEDIARVVGVKYFVAIYIVHVALNNYEQPPRPARKT